MNGDFLSFYTADFKFREIVEKLQKRVSVNSLKTKKEKDLWRSTKLESMMNVGWRLATSTALWLDDDRATQRNFTLG